VVPALATHDREGVRGRGESYNDVIIGVAMGREASHGSRRSPGLMLLSQAYWEHPTP
jgi:hypothetical protein